MKSFSVPVPDVKVSRLILKHYFADLEDAVESDVIVAGAGPSGLTCAWSLAEQGYEVTVIDRRLAPGGGIWGGAMSFNKVVLQKDVEWILKEAEIPFVEDEGALVVSAPLFASKLIAKAAGHPRIKFFNMLTVIDLHSTGDRITGVVVNNSAVEIAGLHVDPMVLTAKAVLDATGHDAVLSNLYSKRVGMGLVRESFMNAEKGEEDVVQNTRMLAPGLFVAGMAANNVEGGCRMGPIFGGMLLSGKKAARLISDYLSKNK
ncbi:MAG: sulfide-dependent adenosine diphosphate thiazole synthase [Tepidanaerobacteraceae bacterium]|nr:sulfide-dependent adenosine diphosphate thiazole synthase [Tepidanaerobacteraceae bacterium]